jgi:hypothetical protein
MPVEVHDLKTIFFDYVKTGTNDPINKHYQSNNNNEVHNQQESNDHIDDKDDMQSDDTEESSMDRVLNRSIDALSEMTGLRIPVSLNDPSITDHDNTIPPKNGKAKKMREQKETERVVFKNFWTAINGFCSNTSFHLMPLVNLY